MRPTLIANQLKKLVGTVETEKVLEVVEFLEKQGFEKTESGDFEFNKDNIYIDYAISRGWFVYNNGSAHVGFIPSNIDDIATFLQ